MSEPKAGGAAYAEFAFRAVVLGLLLVAIVRAGNAEDEARRATAAASRAAAPGAPAGPGGAPAGAPGAGLDDIRADLDMLSGNVNGLQNAVRDLAEEIRYGRTKGEDGPLGGGEVFPEGDPRGETLGNAPPPAQPFVAYTAEQKAALRAAALEKGVVLGEDRVSVPAEVILREGALEFLAVFSGGKAHESVFLLCGKRDAEGAAAPAIGATLNASLMALGLRPGTPLRVLPGGRTRPPTGTTVHLSVEWREDGRLVRARVEDLLWDRERNAPLEPGKFLYTGSFFQQDGYLPDLSGDAVALYSTPYTLIDLDDPRAVNDTIFVPCTPRIPAPGTKVDIVFSPAPLEPTRRWDAADPAKRTDAPGPDDAPAPAPAPAPADAAPGSPGGPR
jgi:hypothetical protein